MDLLRVDQGMWGEGFALCLPWGCGGGASAQPPEGQDRSRVGGTSAEGGWRPIFAPIAVRGGCCGHTSPLGDKAERGAAVQAARLTRLRIF
jgi:hypothetical protein